SEYGRCCAAPTAKRALRTPASRAFFFAAAMPSTSGSRPSTLTAKGATPSAKRPSPHPRSRMRFPRTSRSPPHSRSSSTGRGRSVEETAGTCFPTSPARLAERVLTFACSLHLAFVTRRRVRSGRREFWSGGRDSGRLKSQGACLSSLRCTDSGRFGRELLVAGDLSLALNSHVDFQPFQPS